MLMQTIDLTKDYYAILGIPISATPNDIKIAYRKHALASHPDKFSANRFSNEERNAANQQFINVGEAYEVLSHPQHRGVGGFCWT